jgi:hypothetical protein
MLLSKTTTGSEVVQANGSPDRVWVTYGEKVQFRDYSPTEVTGGYSSDVRLGETPDQALRRCFLAVQKCVDKSLSELAAKKR